MNTKQKKIIGRVIGTVAIISVGAGLAGETQKLSECKKAIKYEMTVMDGEKNAPVSICEDKTGLETRKTELLTKIAQNRVKVDTGVSPSVEALLIAYNEPDFAEELTAELLKKYDPKKHAFKGSEMDTDFIEQRALFFELAGLKCAGGCEMEGETPNEWAYNLLTKP